MILRRPEVMIVNFTPEAEKHIEIAGRVCYKSENLITAQSAGKFIKNLIRWF